MTAWDSFTGTFDEQPVSVAVVDPSRGTDQTGEALATALPVYLSPSDTTTLAGSYAIGNGVYGRRT